MSSAARSIALLLLVAATTACASATPTGAGRSPRARPLTDTGLDGALAARLLTVYPTPRQAVYGDVLLPLDGHRRVDVSSEDFLDVLEARDLTADWRDLPPEGFVVEVSWTGDHTLVLVAAADDVGARWADEALRQLSLARAEGPPLIRDCLIVDAPGFPLRGSKRPQEWEVPYRANFAWGVGAGTAHEGREMVSYYAPGSPLDVSPEALSRTFEHMGAWHARGVTRFAVKFDDVGFGLTPASRLAFGSYPRALVAYMRTVVDVLRQANPNAIVYFLPQTYWWNDPRFPEFSRALRLSGGLDAGVGLVLTGPEIISATIDAPGLAAGQRAFGVGATTRALVYDNLGREGDWGPLTGRDPDLVDTCEGVFGERGTPVHRLTRLDWSWNPRGYDPERSWRRALLELAGPEGHAALETACRAFREDRDAADIAAAIDAYESAPGLRWPAPLPRRALVQLLRDDLRRRASSR